MKERKRRKLNFRDFSSLEEYVEAMVKTDDSEACFDILCSGLTPGEIRHFKRKKEFTLEYSINGLVRFIEAVRRMPHEEYIEIDASEMLFPHIWNPDFKGEDYEGCYDHKASAATFLREGKTFNLKNINRLIGELETDNTGKVTQGLMARNKVGFGKAFRLAALSQTSETSGSKNIPIEDSYGNFIKKIAKRGLTFEDPSTGRSYLSQVALTSGWRHATVILLKEIEVKFGNPPGGFYVHLPSVSEGLAAGTTKVSVQELATSGNMEDNYTYWTRLWFEMSKDEGNGLDIYSKHTRKLGEVPLREIKRQMITALVFRNAIVRNPKRPYAKYGIPPVYVNVLVTPTEDNIEFDLKLINNVRVRYTDKEGNRSYRKLLDSETELLKSILLWRKSFDGCYSVDDRLENLDSDLKSYTNKYSQAGFAKFLGPKPNPQ